MIFPAIPPTHTNYESLGLGTRIALHRRELFAHATVHLAIFLVFLALRVD